jgi:hypothetical protein
MDTLPALILGCRVTHQKTIGADKNYHAGFCLLDPPQVAQNTASSGGSTIILRTTRHACYANSINASSGVEKVFSWIKQWSGLGQFKRRDPEKMSAVFGPHMIAYNLSRLSNLLKQNLEATSIGRCPEVWPGGSDQRVQAGPNARTRAL